MKILTITFHYGTNYGAVLQAYALQQKIQSLGHENLVFTHPENKQYYQKVSFSNPYVTLRTLYINLMLFIRKKKHLRLIKSFKDFHTDHLNLTREYNSMEDLRNNVPDVECLITGSDQVWNMSSRSEFRPAHFLDFGKQNLLRFSYAASIEKLNYTKEQKEQAKKCLSCFKGISVREQSAKEYIESFTSHKVEVVLDPVFLLTKEEWRTVAKGPRIKEPYILCYQVLSNKNMQKVVNKLSKDTGYPIVSICNGTHKWIRSDYTYFDVSPEEFIGLYDNAAVVVSSSFHGTAFGFIFNKPTYSLIKNVSSNRASDLLNKLEMSEFLISSVENLPEPKIDEVLLNKNLEKEREKSIDFIKRMLNEN
jgi:hypothetical protein